MQLTHKQSNRLCTLGESIMTAKYRMVVRATVTLRTHLTLIEVIDRSGEILPISLHEWSIIRDQEEMHNPHL